MELDYPEIRRVTPCMSRDEFVSNVQHNFGHGEVELGKLGISISECRCGSAWCPGWTLSSKLVPAWPEGIARRGETYLVTTDAQGSVGSAPVVEPPNQLHEEDGAWQTPAWIDEVVAQERCMYCRKPFADCECDFPD